MKKAVHVLLYYTFIPYNFLRNKSIKHKHIKKLKIQVTNRNVISYEKLFYKEKTTFGKKNTFKLLIIMNFLFIKVTSKHNIMICR